MYLHAFLHHQKMGLLSHFYCMHVMRAFMVLMHHILRAGQHFFYVACMAAIEVRDVVTHISLLWHATTFLHQPFFITLPRDTLVCCFTKTCPEFSRWQSVRDQKTWFRFPVFLRLWVVAIRSDVILWKRTKKKFVYHSNTKSNLVNRTSSWYVVAHLIFEGSQQRSEEGWALKQK